MQSSKTGHKTPSVASAVWHVAPFWMALRSYTRCFAPETIEALKDNIREAIGKIQLHTIDNALKNSTDRVGYCMASPSSHLNEIIFHF